jgi:hypothetical protein
MQPCLGIRPSVEIAALVSGEPKRGNAPDVDSATDGAQMGKIRDIVQELAEADPSAKAGGALVCGLCAISKPETVRHQRCSAIEYQMSRYASSELTIMSVPQCGHRYSLGNFNRRISVVSQSIRPRNRRYARPHPENLQVVIG